jgi:hypothetical protein
VASRKARATVGTMPPTRLFRCRAFSCGNVAGFLMVAALVGMVFFFRAQFLQTGLGFPSLGQGSDCCRAGHPVPGRPVRRSMVGRIGERPLIAAGLTLLAAGLG